MPAEQKETVDTYDAVRGVTVGLSAVGGLCYDGPCDSAVTIDGDRDDGTTTWSAGDGRSGPTDPDATAALSEFVDRSFYDLRAEDFDGTCPTAYDGREVHLVYSQLPTGPNAHLADAVHLTSSTCQHVWPDGFVDELRALWTATGAPWPLDDDAG